jgi:hypothetical protein
LLPSNKLEQNKLNQSELVHYFVIIPRTFSYFNPLKQPYKSIFPYLLSSFLILSTILNCVTVPEEEQIPEDSLAEEEKEESSSLNFNLFKMNFKP